MEYLHGFPELWAPNSRADIQARCDNRHVVECADGDIYHNTKGASSTTSQCPKQVTILIIVGFDRITLSKPVSLLYRTHNREGFVLLQ